MTREEKWDIFLCFLDLNGALEPYLKHAEHDVIVRCIPKAWVNTFGWGSCPEINWVDLYYKWVEVEKEL